MLFLRAGFNYRHRFLAWGELVVIGSHWSFELDWAHQHGLAYCDLETREEIRAWGN